MNEARFYHTCNLVQNSGGQKEIVVVGGYDENWEKLNSVEIYSIIEGKWRTGNITYYTIFGKLKYKFDSFFIAARTFPLEISVHASTRLENSFIITGGGVDSIYL